MNTYLVAYELFSGNAYMEGSLEASIKSFGYWARPINNIWLIKSYNTKEYIMGILRQSLGITDKLLIMQVNNEWISTHLGADVVNWMKSGL